MKNSKYKWCVSSIMLTMLVVGATARAGVVAYWRIEDGVSGNDIVSTADSSGNGYTAAQWTGNEVAAKYSSTVGGAYVYDPVTDTYVANSSSMHASSSAVGDDTQLIAAGAGAATGSSWTYEMFILAIDGGSAATLDSSNSSRLLNIDSTSASAVLELRHGYRQARARDNDATPVDANIQLWSGAANNEDAQWHHWAVTVNYDETEDLTTIELFYDYVSLGTATDSGQFDGVNDLRFGLSSTADGDLDWFFDEARLSDTALTSDQFLQLSPIPEPVSVALLSLGGLIMLGIRRLSA